MNETIKRALTATGFVIIMLGSALLGKWAFLALMCIANIFALLEYSRIFKFTSYTPFRVYIVLIGTLCFSLFSLTVYDILPVKFLSLLLPLLLLFPAIELYNKRIAPFERAGISILGILYISLPLAFFPFIGIIDGYYDPAKIIGCMLLIWSNDTFAYFVGRLLGKTPLFPSVSPKKTWEGSIGGAVFSVLTSILLHFFIPAFSLTEWITLSIIFILFSTLGDLVESRLKRSFNIKDSGNLLPGHGGILDRLDAQLFSVPFAATYLLLMHHHLY